MKIVLDGKIYVQKNDILYVIRHLEKKPIPNSVFDRVFSGDTPFVCADHNRYEFVEFDDKEAIEFFKNLDYSVDYLALKSMSETELCKLGQEIADKKDELVKKYNAMTKEEKSANDEILEQCSMLTFKMLSIRDVVWIKKGQLKIKFPKGIEENKLISKIKNIIKKR